MALTKAHNRMIKGADINVLDYGAIGDGASLTARAEVSQTYMNLNQGLSTGTFAIVGMDTSVSFLFINVCYKAA